MQDITSVFNKDIVSLPAITANDLLKLTSDRTLELGLNNPQSPQWLCDETDEASRILLFSNAEKAKKYEDRVQAYLQSGKDKNLLAPATFSMFKFATNEYIGQYDNFIVSVNIAPYLNDNGILISAPIEKDGVVYEKYQRWSSVEESDLLTLQRLTKEKDIVAWGSFMLPSNAFCHFHFMSDSFEGKKLPLVKSIESGLYSKDGIRLASAGYLGGIQLNIRVVDNVAMALRGLQDAESQNIKSDLYVIDGKFLLLHYVGDDNVVQYTYGRQWIPSPDGIGFSLYDDRMNTHPAAEIIKDFWIQKNSQLRLVK